MTLADSEMATQPAARVLYVEDNAANVTLMERLFKMRPGIELLVARDGVSACQLISTAAVRLVFMDLNLPDVSGEQLIEQFRSQLHDATPPIVVLSADAVATRIESLRLLGIAEYVTKPYDLTHVFSIIDTYCDPS